MVKMMIAVNPKAGMGSPEGKDAGKDLGNFGDPGSIVSVITDEHPVLWEVAR